MKLFAYLIFFINGLISVGMASQLPLGLMLNLDFETIQDGLIPSKALYPLYVPQDQLGIERFNHRNLLSFQIGQGLSIPHSSLLDPNGDEWIASVRVFALTDGIIMSQTNERVGYVIYMKDGHIYAAVKTGHSSFTLQERVETGLTKYTKRWVTIELRIRNGMAMLNLNRKRVGMVRDEPGLNGDNLRIRLGHHENELNAFMYADLPHEGFSGAISSFKILRQ